MNRARLWFGMHGLGALALAFALVGPVQAQAPEQKQVTLAVGGKTALYYLPLTIAERLGHFKEQGLDVTINDFRGGAQSLQALARGPRAARPRAPTPAGPDQAQRP